MQLSELIELNNLARDSMKGVDKRRFAYESLFSDNSKHFVGIVGARGIGKTTMLKQFLSCTEKTFYISMDTFDGDLFHVVKSLVEQMGIKYILLDEVHFYKGFEGSLKKIYDFLDVKVYFTGSVALALFESSYDLSRRVVLKTVYPFSFREYLWFKYDKDIELLNFQSLLRGEFDNFLLQFYPCFKDYLCGGLMPFALNESNPLEIVKNILQTIINRDIAVYAKLSIDELAILFKMISFIGKSKVDGINYTSISNNLKITKYKAAKYVDLLEKAFVLRALFPEGSNVLKEPKVLMSIPYRLLFREYEDVIGGIREDYFAESMYMAGFQLKYLKSTKGKKTPDFIISDYTTKVAFEVGGKGKGREQFKGIKIDEKIIFSDSIENKGIKRPLFLTGFLV